MLSANLRSRLIETRQWWLAGAAALVILLIWNSGVGFSQAQHHPGDFTAYLDGARAIAAGTNPYHRLVTQAMDTRAGSTGFHASGYVYFPLLADLLVPFVWAGLSTTVLVRLWSLALLAAIVAMGWVLQRHLCAQQGASRVLGFSVLLLLPTIMQYDLWLGQVDILVVSLAVLACSLWLRDNPWSALTIGAAIAIKPTMGFVLLLWLWKGDWRGVLRAVLVTLALIVVPFIPLGLDAARDYITFFIHWNALGNDGDYINQSLNGMVIRAFAPNPFTPQIFDAPWLVAPLRIGILAAVLAWYARSVPRQHQPQQDRALLEMLAGFPLLIVLSPLVESIHYDITVPVLVAFAWVALTRKWWRVPAAWMAWLLYLFMCIPNMHTLIYPDRFIQIPGQHSAIFGTIITLARTGTLLWVGLSLCIVCGFLLRKPISAVEGGGEHEASPSKQEQLATVGA